MTQTRAERLAYARGYNRARARSSTVWVRLAEIARAYRQRLREPVTQTKCGDCRRWTRGGDGCRWGYCDTADFNGHEPRMWSDYRAGEREARKVVTQAEFGCVNWLPAKKDQP